MAVYLVFQPPELVPTLISAGYVEADDEQGAVAMATQVTGLTLTADAPVHAVPADDAARFMHEATLTPIEGG